jgi:hypothetical protein
MGMLPAALLHNVAECSTQCRNLAKGPHSHSSSTSAPVLAGHQQRYTDPKQQPVMRMQLFQPAFLSSFSSLTSRAC